MRHADVIFLVCLAASALAVGQRDVYRDGNQPDIVVTDSYFSPDAGEIRLKGVCDVLSPTLQCWGVDQRLDSELAQQVSAILKKSPLPANSQVPEIQFRFRHKNRLVVFESASMKDAVKFSARLSGFYSYPHNYMQDLPGTWDPQGSPREQYLPLVVDRGETTTSIMANLTYSVGKQIEVPWEVGSSRSTERETVTISSVKVGTGIDFGGFSPPNQKSWSVLLKLSGDSIHSRIDINVQPVDGLGNTIASVDVNGNPMAPPKDPQHFFMTPGMNTVLFSSGVGPYQPLLGGRIWKCLVNPKYIKVLHVNLSSTRYVQFKNIPLDPKLSSEAPIKGHHVKPFSN